MYIGKKREGRKGSWR